MRLIKLMIIGAMCMVQTVAYGHHIIRGVIISADDQSPLLGAVVQIIGETGVAIADDFGRFELAIEETSATLKISFVGFQTKEILVHEHEGQITVQMEPAVMKLSQVNIHSTKVNSVNSISKIDVNLRAINSSQDILRIVPGLFIAQHAGGGKAEQIFLRGFDTDHGTDIRITVDGMPVNMVSHSHGQGYADLHFTIPELINNIDFGKGPYYSDKGNLATAGYVDFHTLNALKENLVKAEAGQFNTFRTLGVFDLLGEGMNLKGHNAYMAAEYLLTDGPFQSPQNFNRINLFSKYSGYLNDNNFLTVQFSKMQSKWDASGQIPDRAVKSGLIDRFGAIDDTEGGYTGRSNASVRLVKNFGSGLVTDNQLFYSKYDFELYSNFTFYLNNPDFGDQIRQKENRDIYGLNGSISKSLQLDETYISGKIGYGFRYDDIDGIQLVNTQNRAVDIEPMSFGDIDETNTWLFLDGKIERGRWLVNAGIRMDYFKFDYVNMLDTLYSTLSEQKVQFSPKLNIIYNLNKIMRLYAKSGIGFHSNDSRVVVQNSSHDILPSAYGLDVGLTIKPVSSIYLNLSYWYLFLEQEFVYVGDEAVVEPSGKTQRNGFDASIRWQVLSWLFADADLNYAHGRSIEDEKGSDFIPLAPSWTSTGGLTVQMKNGFSSSIRYRYIKNRPANEDNSIVALGYFVVDFKANYRWKKLELGMVIENLLNTEWNEAQFATLSRLQNEPQPVDELHYTPGVPFFFKTSIAYYF